LGHEIPTKEKGDSVLPEKPETGWTVVQNRKLVKYEILVPVPVEKKKKCGMTGTDDSTRTVWGVKSAQRAHPHKTEEKLNIGANHIVSSEETNGKVG
jgi:hypothetical protein